MRFDKFLTFEPEKKLVQIRIDPDLYQKLKGKLKAKKVKLKDFLEAAIKVYLAEE